MPWLSHLFPEIYMKQYHYGHTFSKSDLHPPNAQYGHNHSIHHIHLSMQERAHTNQSVEPTPATAHSGTYIHTNQSVDNIQQQLTLVHTNQSVDNIQQQLTLVHTNTNIKCILYIHVYNIHTHTINPECGDTQQLPRVHTYSGVEILLATTHSGTHKPERG